VADIVGEEKRPGWLATVKTDLALCPSIVALAVGISTERHGTYTC
jgi:hypothetical protein